MREKIEAKVKEIIESIIAKDVKDITYNEYRILDNKLCSIKYEEETKRKNEELTALMTKTFTGSIGSPVPMPLPDTKED